MNLAEKKVSSSTHFRKMRSPGHRFKFGTSSSLIHSRLPSGESMRLPSNWVAVKRKAIQSSMPSNCGKVRMPLSCGL